ncbi:MAG: AMP-binding protein [Alphaproteobacteria bacterium]|nr:AMP-binding protein [Alphaproteobacteria bacterium]
MGQQPFDPAHARISLFDALLRAKRRRGGKTVIVEDHDRKPLSYDEVIRAAFALGGRLKRITAPREAVGVLLPTGVGAVVTFFALHAIGRTPAMLNFTAGPANLNAGCAAAHVRRVLTARRFVEQGQLERLVGELGQAVEITYLEDLRESLGLGDKLGALVKSFAPSLFRAKVSPDEPGVVLFTSGSFGSPRGAVLSHANIVSNVQQIYAHVRFDPNWRFFNPLPMFHCYGLTGGALMPVLCGHKAFLYPSPLHFKEIPRLVRETDANVMFATDTFATQYARGAQDGDLSSLVFMVLGAERVKPETREVYQRRFGVELLEGYGATEASPVIAVNQPGANIAGSVGRILPGIEWRLEEIPGIREGKKLIVRGPNVMKGYLNPAAPDGVDALPDGWHDTGDIVEIDADGYVRIVGRAKRFAKIGGEMVSLNAVETIAQKLWPLYNHAAISLPCPRKGERLVLFSDNPAAQSADLMSFAQAEGAPEISVPRKIVPLPQIPVLGTGKTDYVALQRLAEETITSEAA